MKNIFELKYSDYYSVEDFTDDVKFYERFGSDDLIEFLTIHNKEDLLSVKHLLKHAEDEFNEYLEEHYNWEYGFDDGYNFKDFKKDFITYDDFSLELYNFILCELKDDQLEKILNEIGIKFGTVGYSQWSYYIALDDVSDDFISDLYNGYNIYDIIQYNEAGNTLDALHLVYAPNTSDLIACINDYFILNNDDYIYLVSNEASAYIEHKKIKKIKSRIRIDFLLS